MVVRVAEADGSLEGRATADQLSVGQLPQRLTRKQSRFDHFGHPVLPLPLRQRREQRRIDQRPRGPVECADEVLALRQVDRGLAADRRVHLRGQRRRDRYPVNAAQVGRGGIARRVGERAATERDDRSVPPEPERAPQALDRRELLGRLTGRKLVGLVEGERDLGVGAVDPGHDRLGDERGGLLDEALEVQERTRLDVDAGSSEDDVVYVGCGRICNPAVERPALVIQSAERRLVLRERAVSRLHTLPGRLDVDVDEHRQRALRQRTADRVRGDCAASECKHGGLCGREQLAGAALLYSPERRLALSEERRDVHAELVVDVNGRPADPFGDQRRERRLSGAHEADEGDVAV